jgi:D-alanine-D-alanine ligase-like ATP-grasp enzyme
VVVQEQVCGDEIRFAVIDGVVKAAILRQTARVVGDGKLTLRALIDAENQSRQIVTDTAVAYPMLDATLIRTGDLDLASVPDHGVVVELAKGTMIRSGASMYNVMDDIHSTYIDMVNDFASKLGRGFVVADMMLQDYTQPMNDDNYAFIEFNITPALQLFYSCRDGKHFRIGEQYLAPMIDKVMQGSYL